MHHLITNFCTTGTLFLCQGSLNFCTVGTPIATQSQRPKLLPLLNPVSITCSPRSSLGWKPGQRGAAECRSTAAQLRPTFAASPFFATLELPYGNSLPCWLMRANGRKQNHLCAPSVTCSTALILHVGIWGWGAPVASPT